MSLVAKRVWCAIVVACASCGSAAPVGTDGGGGGGGGGGGDGGPLTETKSGTVTVESTRYTVSTTEVEQGYATGTFYKIPPVTGTSSGGCSHATHGPCDVQSCQFGGTTSDAGVTIAYTDAGSLTISGVLVNDGTMMLTPGAYGYETVSGAVALFDGGATVRFIAQGNPNGAPAFDVQLVAPSSVQVTEPAFVQGQVVAHANQDLAVAWTGSSAANVTVQLAAGRSGSSVLARCTFSGSSGGGSVPAAAIAAVQSVGGSTSILIMSESRTTQNPDGWDLAFSLQSYGIVSSGLAAGTLQIE
jgi:hypothetical protein